jgi:hypothetical protein
MSVSPFFWRAADLLTDQATSFTVPNAIEHAATQSLSRTGSEILRRL